MTFWFLLFSGLTVRDYNDDRTKRLPDVVFCFDNAKRCSLVLEISHSESMRHVQEKSRLYMTSKSNMVQTVVCFHVQYLRRSGNGRSDTIAVNEPPQVREIKVGMMGMFVLSTLLSGLGSRDRNSIITHARHKYAAGKCDI